jgi:hypothetical protein
MSKVTAVIKSIGRDTIHWTIESVRREGLPFVVVADGYDIPCLEPEDYTKLPKNWGCYGSVAANVGVALADTDYVVFVDDDDELSEGAGEVFKGAIEAHPEIDIWIQGLKFNNGMELCMDKSKGCVMGNVAVPIYKTKILTATPFTTDVPAHVQDYTDFFHILLCQTKGATLDWLEELTYLVRPKLEGTNGRGKD